VRNLAEILRGAEAAILATGGVDESQFAGALESLAAYESRTDAAFWYVIRWAEGVKP
jgi:hypothetical protein